MKKVCPVLASSVVLYREGERRVAAAPALMAFDEEARCEQA